MRWRADDGRPCANTRFCRRPLRPRSQNPIPCQEFDGLQKIVRQFQSSILIFLLWFATVCRRFSLALRRGANSFDPRKQMIELYVTTSSLGPS
jgi:hypothetical protein